MAVHLSENHMKHESLVEMLLVAKYCTNYSKDIGTWGSAGCFGYPAAILLFAIADSIGAHELGGNTANHFTILTDNRYYNLPLDTATLETIYKGYRCRLTHESVMNQDLILDIDNSSGQVYHCVGGKIVFYLKPFFNLSKIAVTKFLNNLGLSDPNSERYKTIIRDII